LAASRCFLLLLLLLLLPLLHQIIHVNLTSGEPVLLKEGQQVTFTFAVNWLPTTTPFGKRFERYLDYNFFEHKVRLGHFGKDLFGCRRVGWCCGRALAAQVLLPRLQVGLVVVSCPR
jgi:hypothetical protein